MAQKPKTFRDSKGNIRQIGTSKIVKRAAVNPLDAAVNSAIGAQVQPYTAMDKSRLAQYEKDAADTNAVQATLQDRLAGIQSGLQSANADALGLAAQRGTASADQMQRNMDFLKQTLGSYTSDQGVIANGVQPGVVASGADAAANAAGVGFAGSASANQLAAQRGASVMAGGERSAQLLNARKQDQLAIQREIARIRAQAPLLKRQFGRENAELSMVRQELGLKKDAAAEAKRQFDESLAASSAAALAGDAEKAAKSQSKYKFGINAKYDKDIDGLYAQIASATAPKIDPTTGKPMVGADGKPVMVENGARRWRDVIGKLRGLGVNGGQALLLATKWMPERLAIHGNKSPQVIYRTLKAGSPSSGGLGFKVSDAVAKQVFKMAGLDWNMRMGPMHRPTPPTSGGTTNKPAKPLPGRPEQVPVSNPVYPLMPSY